MKLVTDVVAFCAERVPKWNPISISGYHIREAGSTAVQEVAFTLANGLCYVDAALERGLAIDDFAPRLSFFFNSHNDFLEEVAKFRAARRLWAELLTERYAPKDQRSLWLRFHTQTGGSTLTAQQPDNNVVRVAIQALAAVCGGTQSLHTNGRDEALGLPTEDSALLALRTQQIVAHESGITRVRRSARRLVGARGGDRAHRARGARLHRAHRRHGRRARRHRARLPAARDRRGRLLHPARDREGRAGDRRRQSLRRRRARRRTEILEIDPRGESEQVERLRAVRAGRDAARAAADHRRAAPRRDRGRAT